jgi:hypothetical protein
VIYKTKTVEGDNRNFEIFDPLNFRAAVTSKIPNRGEHLLLYYGHYSSLRWGAPAAPGVEEDVPAHDPACVLNKAASAEKSRRRRPCGVRSGLTEEHRCWMELGDHHLAAVTFRSR